MDNHKHRYQLKNGKQVTIIATYQDYFSEEQFVVIKEDEKISIARALEFAANIMPKEKSAKRTTDEKVQLYRSYFRGNEKMYATSFKKSDGKRQYYVVCNQRKRPPCPKVKNARFQCSVCSHQKFQPIDNQMVLDHLRGVTKNNKEAFYGIYPIMTDNQVYFLALDFDKKDWRAAVEALVSSAHQFKLKPLLELSQSGNGCHIWFFFETATSAKQARLLGNLLLRHAMLRYPELTFDSFDRLFPSQDELGPGGFGNLIALPLQGARFAKGCSRFIDSNFKVIEDVWQTLENAPKIANEEIGKVIQEIQKAVPAEFYKAPKQPEPQLSLLDESQEDIQQFQNEIKINVANELIIQRADIPLNALVQLKFMATFHNQEFYAAQSKRLPTYNIPRIISLATIDEHAIHLPRGLQSKVAELFPNAKFVKHEQLGKALQVSFNGQLYDEQSAALSALSAQHMGILCAGTGFGKTVVAAKLIADKKVSTLILVHNKNLAIQWKNQLEKFLTIDDQPMEEWTKSGRKRKKEQIGKLYGGQENRSGLVDIALFQSITKHENLREVLNQYGMIIVDEAHHVAALTFENVVKQVGSRYLYGLTATPRREDHLENILYMRLGAIAYTAEKKIPLHINQQLFLRFTALGEQQVNVAQQTIHENYEAMLEDADRNQQIVADICANVAEKRHLIVLSRYVKHLAILKQLLEQAIMDVPIYMLTSKMKNKVLHQELTDLKKEGRPFVLLTTGSYAGEGFDLPALDTLLLVMPISGKSSLQQYLGRLLRKLEDKNELRVYDYVDYAVPMLYRMYQKRLGTYKKLGYHLYDDQMTELSRSNLFTDHYQEILFKDLKALETGLLTLPYLSKAMFNALRLLNNPQQVTLLLPAVTSIAEKKKVAYQLQLEQLQKIGYTIKFKRKIAQHFAVLNDEIVWMLPESREDSVALRLLSRDIAGRLVRYFGG